MVVTRITQPLTKADLPDGNESTKEKTSSQFNFRTYFEEIDFEVQAKKNEKRYKCGRQECGAIFLTAQALADHETLHLPSSFLQCQDCMRTFVRVECFRRHLATHRVIKPGGYLF